MEITICYIIISVLEALILWHYCSSLFTSLHSKKIVNVCFIIAYTLLFVVSQKEVFWINLSAFLIVNFILILFLYNIRWYSAFFHASVIAIVMSLSEIGQICITVHFTHDFYAEHSYFKNLLYLTIFSKMFYFFVLQFIVYLFKSYKDIDTFINTTPDKSTFLLNFIPASSLFIIITLTDICLNTPLSLKSSFMVFISTFFLLAINIVVFYIYNYNQKKNYEFTQLQIQLQKENNSAKYYEMLLKQDENQKILIHDIKKHLMSISSLNESGKQQQITEYIGHIINSSGLWESVRICANEHLNAILCHYARTCHEENISFHTDIRKNTLGFMPYNDITALFCNLMDNAVEAAENISQSYIELSVSHKSEAGLTIILMVNSCLLNPFSKETGVLLSVKENDLYHGYGLKSIEKIVNKYNGDMQIYYDENNLEFHTIIILKD